jgi:hypothetical protein
MAEDTTEASEESSIRTQAPGPGLYEAEFMSPLDAPDGSQKRWCVQVVELEEASSEVEEGRTDPITRQAFKSGDRVIRYALKENGGGHPTGEIKVEFPNDPTEWETTTLESLRFINAPEGEDEGDVWFVTPGKIS